MPPASGSLPPSLRDRRIFTRGLLALPAWMPVMMPKSISDLTLEVLAIVVFVGFYWAGAILLRPML